MTADQQRRGASIAMSPQELDAFLAEERNCRMATVGKSGEPHVTPLWFVWDGTALWISSIVRSQRWTDIQRDSRVAAVVDAGAGYNDLRGVEISGTAAAVGEIPRTGEPVAALHNVESLYAQKYAGGEVRHDGRHAWLRITPTKIVSWDFRKRRA
jgi:PPOX class probable F420-dependent enzyme